MRKIFLTTEERALRRQQDLAEQRKLVLLIKNNKAAFMFIFVMGVAFGGLAILFVIDYFVVQHLRHEVRVNQIIVECFYHDQCKQKIMKLNPDADRSKIADISYAFGLKQFIAKNSDLYKQTSSENKERIDKILKLTN